MATTEKLVLGDKNIYPTEEFIFSKIGNKKIIWSKIMNYVTENYPDAASEWRYYNDGKQWLFKLTRKKKTIFWLSLLEDTFRITFYFGDKAEPLIKASSLPGNVKNDFSAAKRFGSLRPVTTILSTISDAENIFKLIDIKLKLK